MPAGSITFTLFPDAMLLSTNLSEWPQTLLGSSIKGDVQCIILLWQEEGLWNKGGQHNSYKLTVKSGSIFIFPHGSTAGNSSTPLLKERSNGILW